MREEHRLISRPRADLEDALGTREAQQLEVARVRRRLRDRLPVADGQRAVLVRAVTHAGGHEEMARRLIERAQHVEVANAAVVQHLDEMAASAGVLAQGSSIHHDVASSSMRVCVRSSVSGVTDTNPSFTARKSESSAPLHSAEPPPIQKISRPRGSCMRTSESEYTRLPNRVRRMPLICAAGSGGRLMLSSVSRGMCSRCTRWPSSLDTTWTWSASSAGSALSSPPANDSAMAGMPNVTPSIAAATVPEYSTSSPMLWPWLMPLNTKSGR